jgi:hypothetical protein
VVTVALDSAGATAAGEWIRAAQPTHPSLIDAHYDLATRYHLVNVPSAVWIDESGRIVRPAEVAFADNRFIAYTKFDMTRYLDAIRDWVDRGEASPAPRRRRPPPASGSPSICTPRGTRRPRCRSSRRRSASSPSRGATSGRRGRSPTRSDSIPPLSRTR